MFSNLKKKCAVYEITSKNMVKPERPQMSTHYGAHGLHGG